MLQEFIDSFMENKQAIEKKICEKFPGIGYKDIVEIVFTEIGDSFRRPDPEKIQCFGGNGYDGTFYFFMPSADEESFWGVAIFYGSCSGCDAMQAIADSGSWDAKQPNKQQLKDYMTLALHIIQGTKELDFGGGV